MGLMYTVPAKYFFRLHHIRPRFKNDVENVLSYMAVEIAKLKPGAHEAFAKNLNGAIKLYPGNASKEAKTINNWRTEISSLFGLIEYDGAVSKPGRMAGLLAETQDLIEFFRHFLFYFQYPGGHLKPRETFELIAAGIKFKPAKYILLVLQEGKKLSEDGKFGITKAEATHCIFNDLRVTRDGRPAAETAALILENRKKKLSYDSKGDVIRYAGDILDYMELAGLVSLKLNYQYYLSMVSLEAMQAYLKDKDFFRPYIPFYGNPETSVADVTATQQAWFKHVNNRLAPATFRADIASIIEEAGAAAEIAADADKSRFIKEVLAKLRSSREAEEGLKTKEIGDIGEAIVIEHEKARLSDLGRTDGGRLIKKIPETFAVGYDIASFENASDVRRFIEVKTTISRGKLATKNFHMTSSEWSAANTSRGHYFIYRLMISTADIGLFLIQDPVGKYKADLVDMLPRAGTDINYSDKSGCWEKLRA